MEEARIMTYHISDGKSRSDRRNVHKVRVKSPIAQITGTDRFALYL
ncbi:uncharacterized protein G2W53_010354 [Senna tora]|uniref:Uncharacterized protein n=1 Tax=Senna tora TaxID=362788 RepID=A0A834X0J0_9FABA|nr:uncharacterized protein G2W53_010354 [Senna tora]